MDAEINALVSIFMVPSFLTALLFSCSIVFAYRSTYFLGAIRANFWRLFIGAICLGIISHLVGIGFKGVGLGYFILSGFIGFGLGDVAMFFALPKLGSRLTILLVQCLAAPVAAFTEWLWLGIALSPLQLLAVCTVLTGVALALAPAQHIPVEGNSFGFGIFWGLLAACGQAWGAVLSRKAYQLSELSGVQVDGISAAFQRVVGGLIIAFACYVWWSVGKKSKLQIGVATHREAWRKSWHSVMLNALAGPVLGVSCYQWALSKTPSGIVLPIVAISPLLVIPFSYFLEGDKPTLRTVIGGAIAVIGVIALSKVH